MSDSHANIFLKINERTCDAKNILRYRIALFARTASDAPPQGKIVYMRSIYLNVGRYEYSKRTAVCE